MVARVTEFTSGHGPQVSRHIGVTFSGTQHQASLYHSDHAANDRFSRPRVLSAELEAENIARQVKRVYLAPAVAKNLIGTYRTADHLVDVVGRFALPIKVGVAVVPGLDAGQLGEPNSIWGTATDDRPSRCALCITIGVGRLAWIVVCSCMTRSVGGRRRVYEWRGQRKFR